jgi:chromosome segregation protein
MYLKSLTVLGFKSFAEKTTLNFQPGVTAIVGPNGCGKSNVSDAIRWVLGEQSAKALRGGEMADVIFNGTDNRRPLGMAEVSLTIGGVDEQPLHAAGVELSYNEVTITRRVFRDGASEYFINRAPCRLKDIQQLFMGTGVGRSSYSIMAQGNITQILSSKPEDRRMIFEEAAGITKFKAQKKESLRKLEYTEQNLVRVGDLVREVKRQIGSLQRQAGKARRFKQLSQELQHLDTQLARHQFDQLQTAIRDRQATASHLRAEIETRSALIAQSEDELNSYRERLSELDRQIGADQQRGLELKAEADHHQSRIDFSEERLRELDTQNAKALAEIAQADERRQIAAAELETLRSKVAESAAALDQHRATLASRQASLQAVDDALNVCQERLRDAQADAFSAAQDLSAIRNEITALDLQRQNNATRLDKLSAEKLQLEEERARLEASLRKFETSVADEKLNAESRRGMVEEHRQRLAGIQQDIASVAREQDAALQEQAQKRSRLEVIEQLEAEHEGFSAGSLAALAQSRHVLGSLADRISVPDQFVTAIETALGHHLQLVLTEQPESAHDILAELSAGNKGRASIAPLAFMRNGHGDATRETGAAPDAATTPGAPELNGVPLAATRVVRSDDSVRPLVERLLGTTLIVRDLPSATQAWRDSEGTFHYVTLAGELLSCHGIYTGGAHNGSGNGTPSLSILARKNQITALRDCLETLQAKVADISRRKGALQAQQTELQTALEHAQNDLRAQEVAIVTHEKDLGGLRDSQRLLLQKIETVVYEIQSLAEHNREIQGRRAERAAQAADREAAEQARQAEVERLTAELDSLRVQRDRANSELTECKVALATEEQIGAATRQQQAAVQQRMDDQAHIIEQRRRDASSFLARKEQAETEIVESRRHIESLQLQRGAVNDHAAQLTAQRQALENELNNRTDALREERRRLEALQQERSSVEVELAQKDMAAQNLRERIQQKYHLRLDDVRSECITITFADEGPARIHVMTPDEMAAAGAATDWEAVARQIESLQARIDEMGPVNLVAIEEYEETEQRYQFLSKQHDDLVQAKAQLLEVINRINLQTREMFRDSFDRIRDSFRLMFTEVFGGGKADLVLMDENDLLESGIDIVARPPGKQLQAISLLSGGEQTMTAVALLFAIYQVKPSPFCVLDELDAALDESNINRFTRILQRFLAHSQFIIITHNKRTIAMADVLYGITMQEQGVSKIVSVRFHKSGEAVTDHAPTSLESDDSLQSRDEALDVVMAK